MCVRQLYLHVRLPNLWLEPIKATGARHKRPTARRTLTRAHASPRNMSRRLAGTKPHQHLNDTRACRAATLLVLVNRIMDTFKKVFQIPYDTGEFRNPFSPKYALEGDAQRKWRLWKCLGYRQNQLKTCIRPRRCVVLSVGRYQAAEPETPENRNCHSLQRFRNPCIDTRSLEAM